MSDIEVIKSRINIVDLIGEKVKLKRAGRNYFGLCPFHGEKSPSFSVNEEIQRYKCFGCGEAGDIFNFVMKSENIDFREAMEELADKINYKLSKNSSNSNPQNKEIDKIIEINNYVSSFFINNLIEKPNPGLEYAKKRGLNLALTKKFGIGFAPESYNLLTNYLLQKGISHQELDKYSLSVNRDGKYIDKFRNRLMFNLYDDKGRIVGFAGRFIGVDKGEFKTPKYLNSAETILFHKSKLLFGLYQAKDSIRKLKFAIICEGQMNVISSAKVGVENIVASLGTSLTEQHLRLLSRFTENILLAFDKDTAGKKALLRALEMGFKLDLNMKVISWDAKNGGDPDELITTNPKLWVNAVNSPQDPIDYLLNEFNSKYTNPNSDQVNNLLKLVLNLLKYHSNKVKVEFYIKHISEKLGISVEILKDFNSKKIENIKPNENFKNNELIDVSKNPKRSPIAQIFSLILQNWSESTSNLILLLERDILPENYQELYDYLTLCTDISEINTIREELSEDLQELFDELVLMNNEIDESKSIDEHITKLIPMAQIEYKKALVNRWKENPEDEELINKITSVLGSGNDGFN